MAPDISEFSYGYALTEELVNNPFLKVQAAPVFPSLIAEGKAGGGYDVKLPFAGFALFLQFKLSDCMVRGTAHEVATAGFSVPFYRMHIRPGKHSRQHQLLLDLQNSGEMVYYAAPHFHRPRELNDAYLTRSMIRRSLFVEPNLIGPLDDEWHHVAFHSNHGAYLFSEPKRLLGEGRLSVHFEEDLVMAARARPRIGDTPESLEAFANKLVEAVERRIPQEDLEPDQRERLRERDPVRRIGFISRTFLGCEVLVVRAKN